MTTNITKSTLLITMVALAVPLACDKADETPGKADAVAVSRSHEIASEVKAKPEVEAIGVEGNQGEPLDDEIANTLSKDANETVAAISDAREALAKKDKAAAKNSLAQARKAIDRIIAERPTIELALTLWTNDKEIDTPELEKTVETIPLFVAMDRIEERVGSPEDIAARKSEREGAKLSVGDKRADMSLIDANLVYTEIDMPIASTHVHVVAAQKLVNEGKLEQADQVLEDAEGSLEVVSIIEKAPEFEARSLIWDAEAAFIRGDMVAAEVGLESAKAILEAVTKDESASDETRELTKALLEEIAPLVGTLKVGKRGQATALSKLKRGVWGLAQRQVARAMLLKRKVDQRFPLADALMYLERAENEGLYEGIEGAAGDLILVEAMLRKAEQKVGPAVKPMVESIMESTKKLIEIDVKSDRDPEAIKRLHQELKFELRMLMFDLHLRPER